MDSLIDEIDEVLEENAEEFVKNYVQRRRRVACSRVSSIGARASSSS